MGILANENAISSGGYPISNSLRFQSASSQYLSRTPASAGNQQKHTISVWTKYSTASADRQIISFGNNTTYMVYFGSSGTTLNIGTQILGVSNPWNINTTQVFRDPSAWYHIVVAVDTTQATAANRVKVYVNGTQVTAISGTYPTLNYNTGANTTTSHSIGRREDNVQFYDGYLAEFNWIDGQALTPSSFGETNTLTGQWVAKKYAGTYGTNGFYLPFSNGTSTTTLGYDSSGNGNNWTLTNFTRSAGTSDCWMYDVPSGNGGASGTQPNSNYAVMNPLWNAGINGTISNSNLKVTPAAVGGYNNASSSIAVPSSGYWYAEFIITGTVSGNNNMVGIISATQTSLSTAGYFGGTSTSYGYLDGGSIRNNGTQSQAVASYVANDVIMVAFGDGKLWFGKNGTWLGTGSPNPATATSPIYSGLTGDYYFGVTTYAPPSGGVWNANFGQRSFAYTPPSGFKALCTANLPASTIVKGNQYMDATLYTGNGSTQTITNAGGFSPDIVWTKARSTPSSHQIYNILTGTNVYLKSNSTDAEISLANTLTSFNSNGFTLGSNDSGNQSGTTAVAWQWDAGSSTVTNTNGSISSQVRANPTSGVSVVTYTGTGANATVGHGLGVAPKMIICKNRTDVISWLIYHTSIGATKYLEFNTSAAVTATPAWNNTEPTSSVFTVSTYTNNNGSGKSQVAYCFAEIAGFSKFGSYTGNGSADGTFVYTGFLPKFIMLKRTDTTSDWFIYDTARNTYNAASARLYPDLSNAEDTGGSLYDIDILSNGFKLRGTGQINASSSTWIYACFASNPFANSNAR